MVYLVKGPKYVHKRHSNQIKNDTNVEENNRPAERNHGYHVRHIRYAGTVNSSRNNETVKKKVENNGNNGS